MSPWRLDVVLRLRVVAEERSAAAHGVAVAARIRRAGAAAAASSAWEVARDRAVGDTTSVAALGGAADHLRRLAAEAGRAHALLGTALRTEEMARHELFRVRRDRRVLSSLRDQEERRRHRARETSLDEDLEDIAMRRPRALPFR